MKPFYYFVIGTVFATSALITACGKSGGGGGNASVPGSTAGCVYDASGVCNVAIGPAGYVGDGQWTGSLVVNNAAIMANFAADNGLCGGTNFGYGGGGLSYANQYGGGYGGGASNCQSLWDYVNLQVRLNTGGCLPGAGNFRIQFHGNGNGGNQSVSAQAAAYMNSGSNGIVLDYASGSNLNNNNNNNQFGFGFGFGGYSNQLQQANFTTTNTNNSGTNLGHLQINAQWTNGNRSQANVQLVYRGQIFAGGTMQGSSQFNGTIAAQNPPFCGGNGTQNGGFGYGNGATYQNGQFYNGGVVVQPTPVYPIFPVRRRW